MRYQTIRELNNSSINKILDDLSNGNKKLNGYHDVLSFAKSVSRCGKLLSDQRTTRHWCRKAICPVCSKHAANRSARRFHTVYGPTPKNKFRMVTLGIALTGSPAECLAAFKAFKNETHKQIRKRRLRIGSEASLWKAFGLVGTLEIDMFYANEFHRLGSDKKEQYVDCYGFSPSVIEEGPVWIATFHGVVHLGDLTEEKMRTVFESSCSLVHFQELDEDQETKDAIKNVVGYGHKVNYSTKLAASKLRDWNKDEVSLYVDTVRCLCRGRQTFRMFMRPL